MNVGLKKWNRTSKTFFCTAVLAICQNLGKTTIRNLEEAWWRHELNDGWSPEMQSETKDPQNLSKFWIFNKTCLRLHFGISVFFHGIHSHGKQRRKSCDLISIYSGLHVKINRMAHTFPWSLSFLWSYYEPTSPGASFLTFLWALNCLYLGI